MSATALNKSLNTRSPALRSAEWVVDHNVLVGNMLPQEAVEDQTNRGQLPLIEYAFHAATMTIAVAKTTLGDVMAEARSGVTGELSLFGASAPTPLWQGKAFHLAAAERVGALGLNGPARNGTRGAR